MTTLAQLGILLTLKDLASGPLARFSATLQQTSTRLVAAGTAANLAGHRMMEAMRGPVQAFAEAEDAATRLQTVMMDAAGQVPPTFERVNALATELGNKLPGTTRDFQQMMTVLKEMGVTDEAILGGLGKSAAYLAVALQMPYDEAARFAARLAEASGVAEQDMLRFLDVIARTRNLGVQTGEMEYAFARAAGKLKELGVQGLAASEELAPLYAMLIRTGLSGEVVGTGFAAVLTGLQRLVYDTSQHMTTAREILRQYHITLDVIDRQTGQLKGPRQLVTELEKLRALPAELRFKVLQAIFGAGQDVQMVATLIDQGVAGYQKIASQMAAQASLTTKVEAQLQTLKAVWDAASGTWENVLAKFASLIAPALKRALDAFGRFSEWLFDVLDRYPMVGQMVGITLAFGGALVTAAGAVAIMAGTAIKAIGPLSKVAQWLGVTRALAAAGTFLRIAQEIANSGAPLKALGWHLGQIAGQAKASALAVGGGLKEALLGAGRAVVWLGRAVIANPVGLALSLGALLVYRYWQPITGFFAGLWHGLSQGLAGVTRELKVAFAPALPLVRPLITAFGALWEAIRQVMSWLSRLIAPVEDAGGAAQRFGERVGLAAAKVVRGLLSIPAQLAILPARLRQIGEQIVGGLIDGIRARVETAIQAVRQLGASIRDTLKNLLGIRSPSQVFHDLGSSLADGLSQGMRASLGQVRAAAGAMAGAALITLTPVASPAATATQTIRQVVEPPALASMPRAAPQASATLQITFAPQITVSGSGTSADAVRASVEQALSLSYSEFERLMRRYDAERRRIGWQATA